MTETEPYGQMCDACGAIVRPGLRARLHHNDQTHDGKVQIYGRVD